MELYSSNKDYKLYHGNMLDMLEVIEPNTIDSIITDPPYELNFMNKGWDNSGIAFQPSTWQKCYEVLKPGGFLLAFGGSRTFHRIACAIEDAGFEIRDTIMWLYGSGFPKSMNIGLALDKKNGVDNRTGNIKDGAGKNHTTVLDTGLNKQYEERIAQNKWQGWGTALKPSFEPIIVARKPFKGSLVDNVIEYGVGGINIDECRVEYEKTTNPATNPLYRQQNADKYKQVQGGELSNGAVSWTSGKNGVSEMGRFPANTILTYDDTDFDEVCSAMPDTKGSKTGNITINPNNDIKFNASKQITHNGFNDSGSASRYFYCAKASKKDRDEGLDSLEIKKTGELQGGRKEGSAGSIMLNADGTTRVNPYAGIGTPKRNNHPTVKPTELMQYLIRLVTPKGGVILDPFNGSGSTGKAVMYENKERNKNYKYIGIELTEEYLPISKARIECLIDITPEAPKEDIPTGQTSIFDFIGESND